MIPFPGQWAAPGLSGARAHLWCTVVQTGPIRSVSGVPAAGFSHDFGHVCGLSSLSQALTS